MINDFIIYAAVFKLLYCRMIRQQGGDQVKCSLDFGFMAICIRYMRISC